MNPDFHLENSNVINFDSLEIFVFDLDCEILGLDVAMLDLFVSFSIDLVHLVCDPENEDDTDKVKDGDECQCRLFRHYVRKKREGEIWCLAFPDNSQVPSCVDILELFSAITREVLHDRFQVNKT